MSKEIRETKKVFISYLDDTERKVATYVELISKSNAIVTFKTHNNIITIPICRLLKLKEDMRKEIKENGRV